MVQRHCLIRPRYPKLSWLGQSVSLKRINWVSIIFSEIMVLQTYNTRCRMSYCTYITTSRMILFAYPSYYDTAMVLRVIPSTRIIITCIPSQYYVQDILTRLTSRDHARKLIQFCLIPSHVSITGNDLADAAGRRAACAPCTGHLPLPCAWFLSGNQGFRAFSVGRWVGSTAEQAHRA